MCMNERISVIVPIYNVQAYLDCCVQSILQQTYTNIELILIDDGSTDLSGMMCDCYAQQDSRVVVIHTENKGISCARNVGLEQASGTLFAFVDSDDYLEPTMLSYLYDLYLQTDADIAVCSYLYETESGKRLNKTNQTESVSVWDQKEALWQLVKGKRICTSVWAKLFRASLFTNLRFPEGHIYEDIPIVFTAFLKAKKIVNGKEALYHYLYRSDSTMQQTFREKKLDSLYFMMEACERVITAYPDLKEHCMKRLFEQHVVMYAACRESRGFPEIEKKLFNDLQAICKQKNLSRKMSLYAICARLGKSPFDFLIGLENRMQRKRKQ